MPTKTAAQIQAENEQELLDYLQANGDVPYRQLHGAVSAGAIAHYRRLKKANRIKASVAIVDGEVVHTVGLVVDDAN